MTQQIARIYRGPLAYQSSQFSRLPLTRAFQLVCMPPYNPAREGGHDFSIQSKNRAAGLVGNSDIGPGKIGRGKCYQPAGTSLGKAWHLHKAELRSITRRARQQHGTRWGPCFVSATGQCWRDVTYNYRAETPGRTTTEVGHLFPQPDGNNPESPHHTNSDMVLPAAGSASSPTQLQQYGLK